MWNKLSVIWHGMSGHFGGYHAVESRYWLFVIGSIVSLTILWVNSSVSFNFYRFNVLGKAIGMNEQSSLIGAVVLTFILAFAAWVLLAFLAYILSARLNRRRSALVGISKSDVFFSLLGIAFLAGLDIYANLNGVEEIVVQSTEVHIDDPTLGIDSKFETQRTELLNRLDQRRTVILDEISLINKWTGQNHSCTKTGCPTQKKGKGTIGVHWKGTLTAFGSSHLNKLKGKLDELDKQEETELARLDERKSSLETSLVGAYQQDVQRYHTELGEKNRTLKGFVLIAYPFSFVIEFLLAGITFLALEYLYETEVLERPVITVYQNGEFDSSTKVKNGVRNNGTSKPKSVRKGYEITCKNCGTVATKHHPKAKFCSDDCRIEWHENKKGYSVASIRKKHNGQKV